MRYSDASRPVLLAALACVLSVASVHALDPSQRISQYAHSSWRLRDGSLPTTMYVPRGRSGTDVLRKIGRDPDRASPHQS